MRHPQRVLIDVDDVLARFREGYALTLKMLLGIDVDLADCLKVWDIDKHLNLAKPQRDLVWKTINGAGWCQNLEPMEGSERAIKLIAKKYEVAFVTKPLKTSKTWGYDRRKWISKHFGAELADNLHTTRMKYAVDANYLIDDRVEHIEEWMEDRRLHSKRLFKAILYAQPYNENHGLTGSHFIRLWGWDRILEYLNC